MMGSMGMFMALVVPETTVRTGRPARMGPDSTLLLPGTLVAADSDEVRHLGGGIAIPGALDQT